MRAPGRRLKRLIDSSLADGCSWTERESVAIDKAVKAEDRAAQLQKMLDVELALPEPRSRKVVELTNAIRGLDTLVVKLVEGLVPDPGTAVSVTAKSKQHQDAVNARWTRHSHRKAQ